MDIALPDARNDRGRQIEGSEVGLAGEAHLLQCLQRGLGRTRAECQYGLGIGMLAQVSACLAFHHRGIHAGIDHRLAHVDPEGVRETLAALERSGIGGVVVDADERLDAGRPGALAGRLARSVFRLADVHDRTQLCALLRGAGVDRYDGDTLGGDAGGGPGQYVVVGDVEGHAIVIACGRLLEKPRHAGQVAIGRIAVIHLHAIIVAGLPDRILDGVPPDIRVGGVADQDKSLVRGCAARSNRCGDACKHHGQGRYPSNTHAASRALVPVPDRKFRNNARCRNATRTG